MYYIQINNIVDFHVFVKVKILKKSKGCKKNSLKDIKSTETDKLLFDNL